ncbi:MAG: hypothetical protein JF586_08940 [Burkholderiales bacterium]|nr:hypothetical protein [Burkholderiales bacterium]
MDVVKNTVSASIAIAGILLAGASAQAAPACPSVSGVQSRIVEHANGDVDALRTFVWKTAIVYRIPQPGRGRCARRARGVGLARGRRGGRARRGALTRASAALVRRAAGAPLLPRSTTIRVVPAIDDRAVVPVLEARKAREAKGQA